jgi:hypothetical protein
MTDNLAGESAVSAPEVPAPPTPAISAATTGQPPSTARPALDDSLVEQLVTHPRFQEFAEKLVKSKQDRRFSTIERELKALQAGTGDVTKVRQALDALESDSPPPVAPGRATVAAPADTIETRTAAKLTALNIALDDRAAPAAGQHPGFGRGAGPERWPGREPEP